MKRGEVARGPAMTAEHDKNKRRSTREQHEEGQARKRKDAGREKGDSPPV